MLHCMLLKWVYIRDAEWDSAKLWVIGKFSSSRINCYYVYLFNCLEVGKTERRRLNLILTP